LALINDILDLSKIEAGKMSLRQVEVRVVDVVNDVLRVLCPRAAAKNLTLDCDYIFPLPETLRTDSVRLHEILVNLVGNAIKFTERGEVRIRVSIENGNGARPLLRFEVSDTGIGIAPEQLRLLYQPFTQADNSTRRRHGGTGLGLAISKRLAELLGGTIKARSTPGIGSTFTVTIDPGPFENMRLLLGPDSLTAPGGPARLPEPVPLLHGSVLLAEDGIDNQRLIVAMLRKAGLHVDVAENGRMALAQIQAAEAAGRSYDLILMDMQMPEMDGYEATRKLRSGGYCGSIVALTAHAMAEDREKCLEAGCSDYITKPVQREVLIRAVCRHLRTGALVAVQG
jgi:CheY-like chemotaxis protein/anti-sigma regulatory factor (Ser/Thr protein kinase)